MRVFLTVPPQAQFETWSHNTLFSPRQENRIFFYFQTAFPLQHQDSVAEEYPCKNHNNSILFFKALWTVWAVNYDKIWFTSLHLWLHYFVLTVPLGLSLSQPDVEGCCIFAACNTQLRIPYKLLTGICGPALAQADSHPDSKMMHTVFEATTLHTQDRQY